MREIADEVGATFATLWLFVWALAAHPDHAKCPPSWFVNGVRPSGVYECLRDRDPEAPDRTTSDGHDSIRGRIVCSPTFMPTVRDERSVACGSTIP